MRDTDYAEAMLYSSVMQSANPNWHTNPTIISSNVLGVVVALMVGQKFIAFGDSAHYDVVRSLIYNIVVLLPFSLCIAFGIVVRRATTGMKWQLRMAALFVSGLGLIAFYAVTINALLYAIDYSSEWPSRAFINKYVSGPMHIHAALFVVLHMLIPASRERVATRPDVRPPDSVFGIPTTEILAIEADDHYVWVRLADKSVLKRITMSELSKKLPDHFVRVHRSHIVNLHRVEGCQRQNRRLQLRLGEHLVPVSSSRRAEVAERLPIDWL